MQVNFATNDPATALQYLQKALPSRNLNEENAKPILELVRDGKIRVGDPFMYNGNCPIYPEPACTNEDQQKVVAWYNS